MADKCILDPQRDCIGSKRADMIQEQIQRELEEHKSRSHETHKEILERLNKLETGSAKLEEKYSSIMSKLEELSTQITTQMTQITAQMTALTARITDLERKPAKRWDSVVDKILTAAVAALVGALLIRLGLPA